MYFENFTPHSVTLVRSGEPVVVFPSIGVGRCAVAPQTLDTISTDFGGVVIASAPAFGPVEGLPEAREGVMLIVSRLVASAAGRDDLVVPDGIVRDGSGNIIGCSRFAR
jgi:hypothetical protein